MYTMGAMAYMCPPVRLRRLGLRLRHLGEANGPNLDEAADLMKRARSALGRTENAQVVVRPHEVDHILMKYGVTDERARRTLLTLAAG